MRNLKKSELKEFLFFSVYLADGMAFDVGCYNKDSGLVKKNRKDSDFEKFVQDLFTSKKGLPIVEFAQVDENSFADDTTWHFASNFQFEYVDTKNIIYNLYYNYMFALTTAIDELDCNKLDNEIRKDDFLGNNLWWNDKLRISKKSSIFLSYLCDVTSEFLSGENNFRLNDFVFDALDDFRL